MFGRSTKKLKKYVYEKQKPTKVDLVRMKNLGIFLNYDTINKKNSKTKTNYLNLNSIFKLLDKFNKNIVKTFNCPLNINWFLYMEEILFQCYKFSLYYLSAQLLSFFSFLSIFVFVNIMEDNIKKDIPSFLFSLPLYFFFFKFSSHFKYSLIKTDFSFTYIWLLSGIQ